MKPKPTCQALHPWLRANLGDHCLAPLTGTDAKLLAAAVHLVEAYSVSYTDEVARAFGATVSLLQPQCRELAYHAIAHVMDWGHRPELWTRAGLPAAWSGTRRCLAEPA